MYSESSAQPNKGRHSRGSHAGSQRSSGSSSQPGSPQSNSQTGWFMGFNSHLKQPEAAPQVPNKQPQHGKDVHNRFINRQVTRAAELGDMSMLFEVISSHAAEMNGINLATAFHRVAKLSNGPGSSAGKLQAIKTNPIFVGLLADITRHISGHRLLRGRSGGENGKAVQRPALPGEMPVQCLSIVAWSCATLRVRDEELFAQIASIVEPNLSELKSFELSNLLWAYAKLHVNATELFSAASQRLLTRREGEYKVQCLSTVAWCFATMQWRNASIFKSLAKELAAHPDEAKPQEISTTLWAFAKNRHSNSALFEVFGQAALTDGKIKQFKLQELSNMAWAFATTGLQNKELFEQIERAVLKKLPEMESQSIANIMWAFAKLQAPAKTNLFPTLLNMTLAKQEKFKPQELSAVIWAASQMCPDSGSFFTAAMAICVQRLGQLSANAIANLVKTFSTVKTEDANLFVAILKENLQRLPQLQPQALFNTLHGAANALASPTFAAHFAVIDEAASHICEHLSSRISEFKHIELQQLAIVFHERRPCLQSASAQVLDRQVLERARHKMSQSEEETSASSHGKGRNEDDLWPTASNFSFDPSNSKETSSAGTPPSTCKGFGALPENLELEAALPIAAPLGNTLQSLAQGRKSRAKAQKPVQNPATAPSYLKPDAMDFMPWKVPLPSPCAAPFGMMAAGPSGYEGLLASSGYDAGSMVPEAMLVASFQAMIAATMSGTADQPMFPWEMPATIATTPLASKMTAHYA